MNLNRDNSDIDDSPNLDDFLIPELKSKKHEFASLFELKISKLVILLTITHQSFKTLEALMVPCFL
jgi:hypothetical protein